MQLYSLPRERESDGKGEKEREKVREMEGGRVGDVCDKTEAGLV